MHCLLGSRARVEFKHSRISRVAHVSHLAGNVLVLDFLDGIPPSDDEVRIDAFRKSSRYQLVARIVATNCRRIVIEPISPIREIPTGREVTTLLKIVEAVCLSGDQTIPLQVLAGGKDALYFEASEAIAMSDTLKVCIHDNHSELELDASLISQTFASSKHFGLLKLDLKTRIQQGRWNSLIA